MRLDPGLAASIESDTALMADFEAICDCGGRLAGSAGERRALKLVADLGRKATGIAARYHPVPYDGWKATRAALRLADGTPAACYPLVFSAPAPAGGLAAEVVDLGRGTPADFSRHSADLPGRIALVRHELMFAAGTIHRSRKYRMAREAGAAGFLIAGPLAGAVVAGSAGRSGPDGIPALGIAPETAARLGPTSTGFAAVSLDLDTAEAPAEAFNLIFDLPGQYDEWVVLSAHIDGHEVGESAMDNASGVAAVLAAMRALAGAVAGFRRGLRVMIFNVEEWALTGSARYVAGLSAAERENIALDINLDSVAGSPRLTALTSGFPALGPFLAGVAAANGLALATHLPLMLNSDHGSFALAGIPALRLVAGFDEPDANLRHLLTPADTRDKVAPAELRRAARLAAAIAVAAATAAPEEAARWRIAERDRASN